MNVKEFNQKTMKIKKHLAASGLLLLGLLLNTPTTAWGQTGAKTVMALGKVTTTLSRSKTVVAIRWLPVGDTLSSNRSATNHYLNAWLRYKNRNGYVIERRRAGVATVELTATIYPDTVALGNCSRNNSLGFESEVCDILYGALYEPIETAPGTINGQPIQIELNNAQEAPQRHTLTALGAEMSFKAARMAGLGWIDSTVVPKVNYDYRIREVGSTPADTAIRSFQIRVLSRSPDDDTDLPTLKATFGNKTVALRWRWRNLAAATGPQKIFSSYYVERSNTLANSGYARTSTKPIFPFGDTSDSLYYTAPLDANGVVRYFRLVGRSPFDEETTSRERVSGQGIAPTPRFYPRIDSSTISATGQVYLRWVFPSDTVVANANALLRGFMLRQSADLNAFQNSSGSVLLSNTIRQSVVSNVSSGRYFVVSAIATNGDTLSSIPVFLQPIDDKPPLVPTGLTAIWQDNPAGVRVSWTANSESDLLGYKLFRSNLADEEPSIIADSVVTNFVLDTLIKVNNLNAYYSILAYDNRYNHSALSASLKVKKPDRIAPARPVFRNFSVNQKKITIEWINSVSVDVGNHRLNRKIKGTAGQGSNLKSWLGRNSTERYVDSSFVQAGAFVYYIQAIDSSNNVAQDSIEVELVSAYLSNPALDTLTALYDSLYQQVALKWAYGANNVNSFQLLKAEGTSNVLSSWKTTDGSIRAIYDDNIATGKTYRYAVRAMFQNGTFSNWKEGQVVVP